MLKLQIDIRRREEATVIRLAGSADMSEVSQLSRRLDEIFKCGGRQLVLELSGLEFASSMALGVMIRAHTECRNSGGRLVLVQPQENLREVLRTTRLDELFEFASDVEAGLAVVRRARGPAE